MTTAFTKWVGIPSLVLSLATGGCFLLAHDANQKYENFVQETAKEIPNIVVADVLDKAVDELFEAEKALTYYCVKPVTVVSTGKTTIVSPAIYHHPSVEESYDNLQIASNLISQDNYHEDSDLRKVNMNVAKYMKNLAVVPDGKNHDFYSSQRTEIEELQKIAIVELDEVKELLPKGIFEIRDTYKNRSDRSETAGIILGIIAGLGACTYIFGKATDRYL